MEGSGEDPTPQRSAARMTKHAFDRVTAACGVLVTLPLLAAVALVLRVRGSGDVLRRVERVGEGGKLIVVRSFAVTDAMSDALARLAAGARHRPDRPAPAVDVMRGDMSIIGPRPRELGSEPPPVRPGLTGLAQLAQLERWLSVAEQLELDDEYARTWSLALDARIVWRTMWASYVEQCRAPTTRRS